MGTTHSSEMARARALIFHTLAETVAEPIPGIQELLLEAVMVGTQALNSVACQKAALSLAELPITDLEDLRRGYAGLMANSGERPVVFYESLHRQGSLVGQVTWELEKYYRALGLTPVTGELPDHASVELAFLGHLAAAEAEARTVGNGQLVTRLRAEHRYFLRTHAGAWLPNLGSALAAARNRFYATVGLLLSEFLTEELISRKRNCQTGIRFPILKDHNACTLCGLCVGSCPLGALRVIESATETTLALYPARCIGCGRCRCTCPEGILFLSVGSTNGPSYHVLRKSPRTACPNCGRPTVSQAELDAVFARLQPDPVIQQRLCLCIECKSLSA